MKKDLSISMAKANLYTILFVTPPVLLVLALYTILWKPGDQVWIALLDSNLLITLAILIASIFVHELLHGLSFMLLGKKPFSAIKFGFQLETFTPYAMCKEPVRAGVYRLAIAMPFLILGALPTLIGLAAGRFWLTLFGLWGITGAGGDLLILWLIRHVDAQTLVEDHPTQAGCYVIEDPTIEEFKQ